MSLFCKPSVPLLDNRLSAGVLPSKPRSTRAASTSTIGALYSFLLFFVMFFCVVLTLNFGGYLHRTKLTKPRKHKKRSAGISNSSFIPRTRPSHAHLPRINNAEAHADEYTLGQCITFQWTMVIVLPCGRYEVAKFCTPQIKRFAQRLSYYVL